jgi:FkbM family methyltransferase
MTHEPSAAPNSRERLQPNHEHSRRRPRLNFAVETLVRASSLLIRSIPANRSFLFTLKKFFVDRSSSLRAYQFDFDFYCRRAGLWWSASAFPDLLTRHMLFEGTYDEDALIALRNLISPGDIVYDVGGHHGLMTVVSAQTTGPTGLVIAFEPNPRAREQIRRHTALNEVTNTVLEDIALSDRHDEASFYVQTGDVSWNSTLIDGYLQDEDNRTVECISVRTQTLDEYVAQSSFVPQLIKIDTEGSELRILKGAERTITNRRPIVIMEMNPTSAQSADTSIADFVQFWEQRSYRMDVLGTDVLGRHTFRALEPFDEFRHTRLGKGYANVICIPDER